MTLESLIYTPCKPMFRIKDLMIKVIPEDGSIEAKSCNDGCTHYTSCGECTNWTDWGCDMGTVCGCSNCTCTGGCSGYPSCAGCTKVQTIKPTPEKNFTGNLGDLKAALKAQLAAVEEQERIAEEALKPASFEDAEALEQKLNEALEEVRQLKEQFKESGDQA